MIDYITSYILTQLFKVHQTSYGSNLTMLLYPIII